MINNVSTKRLKISKNICSLIINFLDLDSKLKSICLNKKFRNAIKEDIEKNYSIDKFFEYFGEDELPVKVINVALKFEMKTICIQNKFRYLAYVWGLLNSSLKNPTLLKNVENIEVKFEKGMINYSDKNDPTTNNLLSEFTNIKNASIKIDLSEYHSDQLIDSNDYISIAANISSIIEDFTHLEKLQIVVSNLIGPVYSRVLNSSDIHYIAGSIENNIFDACTRLENLKQLEVIEYFPHTEIITGFKNLKHMKFLKKLTLEFCSFSDIKANYHKVNQRS